MPIRLFNTFDRAAWDGFVLNHAQGALYHLSNWKRVIEKTYGHKTYYLMALKDNGQADAPPGTAHLAPAAGESNGNRVAGILPLVHLRNYIFGNALVSMPFVDSGGVLSDGHGTERALLSEAMRLGNQLKVEKIELRHITPLSSLASDRQTASGWLSATSDWGLRTQSHKVRMTLALPASSEVLIGSFKSKLRSQIWKASKQGLRPKAGGVELLDDFYKVFSVNMRDLGSPVHSKKLMLNVLREFPERSKVFVIYRHDAPLACGLVVGCKDTLANPWSSALREYGSLNANMLLYWTMLQYACDNGYSRFDFGRSSPDEGTFKFKEQWGAEPDPLHWHSFFVNGRPTEQDASEKSKFAKAILCWQKLPVTVTKIIGPAVRKHISL